MISYCIRKIVQLLLPLGQWSSCQKSPVSHQKRIKKYNNCRRGWITGADLQTAIHMGQVLQVLEEKLSSLSENHRNALAADMDEIMYTTEGDVGIYYDDSGRKFVSILMRFWYLTSADLPDEAPDGTKVFHVVIGDETVKKTKHLLTANYEFRREFTQGVKADWTITRIEHPKLLE
nr:m-AAA protease-interacting protein 1, mitochondrial isoform X1 [Chrysemys picta bellii]